jgi:hypothetical protein
MTSTSPKDNAVSGDFSPELVPVVEPGALALTFSQSAGASSAELALGDLLSDALFGEVIDISDLIPRVLSPSAEAAPPGISAAETVETAELGLADGGDTLTAAGHAAGGLTILYDDDMLASDGMIL